MVNFPECSNCHIKILFGIKCFDVDYNHEKKLFCESCWNKNKNNYKQLKKEGKSVLVTHGKYDQNGGYFGEELGTCNKCYKWSNEWQEQGLFLFCSKECESKTNNPTSRNQDNPNQLSNSNGFNWTPWLIGGLVLAIIGIVGYYFFKNRKKK